MTDFILIAAIACGLVFLVAVGLDALGAHWERRAERRADGACTRYSRCPECGDER